MTDVSAAEQASFVQEKDAARRRDVRGIALKSAIGTGAFLLGFAGEQILTAATNSFFPNTAVEKAQILQQAIDERTQNIEALSQSIQDRLATLGGDSELANDTARLLEAIESLKPEIQAAAKMSSSTVARLMSAKGNDLRSVGFSNVSDVDLRSGEGFTLCPQGFSFGFQGFPNLNYIQAQLSGEGEGGGTRQLNPGGFISATARDGSLVSVAYRGITEGPERRYGFDVTCG